MTRQHLSELIGTVIGAIAGALWANPLGAVIGTAAGAATGWALVKLLTELSQQQRLKRKIVSTLSSRGAMQVRDVMSAHAIPVPSDCFPYSPSHPFIAELQSYRMAFKSLESEGRITHSPAASACHGYVDPPNDWVNKWSGRAYQSNKS